jgi:hypothetical protein
MDVALRSAAGDWGDGLPVRSRDRYPVLAALLLAMWTGGMMLIVDLNRPRQGSIRVDPAPLIWTIQGFAAPLSAD